MQYEMGDPVELQKASNFLMLIKEKKIRLGSEFMAIFGGTLTYVILAHVRL